MEPQVKKQKLNVFEVAEAEAVEEAGSTGVFYFVIVDCFKDHLQFEMRPLVAEDVEKQSWARYAFSFKLYRVRAVRIVDYSAHTAMHHMCVAYTSVRGAMASLGQLVDHKIVGRQEYADMTHFEKVVIQIGSTNTILNSMDQHMDDARKDFALGPAGKHYVTDVDTILLTRRAARAYCHLLRHELLLGCFPSLGDEKKNV